MTAAHVLVDRIRPEPERRSNGPPVRVIPGRNGTMAPYGFFVPYFGVQGALISGAIREPVEDAARRWDFADDSDPG